MVVVAIVAILATLAAPSFTTAIANNRVSTAASEVQTLLQFARSEAIYKRSEITLTAASQTWSVKLGNAVLREATLPVQVTVTPGSDSDQGVSFDPMGTAKLIGGGTPPFGLSFGSTQATRIQCVSVIRSGVVRMERIPSGSTCSYS
ncbi:GspH/FimT family pseudopilin [Diaphorobacter aerolatus]|nr:GspH/FimT family pseudopilin [Diaphorobacter aerolatus]